MAGKSTRPTRFVSRDELAGFIHDQVDNGSHSSSSGVVRDALQRLADESKEASLARAIGIGLESGRAERGVFARVRERARR